MQAGPLLTSSTPATLVGFLRRHSELAAAREACLFLADGEEEAARLTYGELDARCRALAAELQHRIAARPRAGERALLLLPPGLEFVIAFLACLYAGVVAVPAYPPASRRHLPRLRAIAADARPGLVLTTSAAARKIRSTAEGLAELGGDRWLAVDAIGDDRAVDWRDPRPARSDVAFLQYTSGSTAAPKGVEVSHANLLHNQELIRRAFELDERAVIAGWLPLYHDMGLIGNLLQALYLGARTILMSPVAFLQKPSRWLAAIGRYRATVSGGPNFAYELCVRKIPPAVRARLDLSSWTVAFSGAEPVRAETLDRFAAAFAASGFERRAFFPCYGLAEATLMVSGADPRAEPVVETFSAAALEGHRVVRPAAGEAARRLVSCGRPGRGLEVKIVDPGRGALCGAGRVGEIWVRGASVARGYRGRREASERAFRARLPGGEVDGEFLRTGDLGFRRGGELFVCGRLKDLIILRGRNHYPQDVEATAERSHPALRPGASAAVAAEVDGEERLVVICELERRPAEPPEAIAAALRQAVAEAHEVQVYDLVLVRTATLPKTSSGKIRRHACLAAWRAGTLAVVARSGRERRDDPAPGGAPEMDREALQACAPQARAARLAGFLAGRAARLLDLAAVETGVPLTRLGLDSLAAVELQQAVESSLGVTLPPGALLDGASVDELAAEILRRLEDGDEDGAGRPAIRDFADVPGEQLGERPLSAGEKALWLQHRLDPEGSAYHLLGAARILSACDVDALRRSFQVLVERHPALRTTFGSRGGVPVARVGGAARFDLVIEELAGTDLARRLDEAAHRPFDLEGGPLLRVKLFRRLEDGALTILLAIHHAVADFASMAILAGELGALYAAGTGGPPAALDPQPVSLRGFARWQRELLAGPEGRRLEAFWRRQLRAGESGEPALPELPTDRPRPPLPSFRGASRRALLSPDLSAELVAFSRRRATTPYVVLLASFQALLHRLSGEREVWVGTPRGMRAAPELLPLVGYLVNPVVARSTIPETFTFEHHLDRSRRAVRAAGDHQEAPFGWLMERLRWPHDPGRSPLFQAMFVGYGGGSAEIGRRASHGLAGFALGEAGLRLDLGGLELESLALEGRGAQFDLTMTVAEIGRERLAARLDYASDLFDGTTAARLLRGFETFLRGIAADPGRRISELPLMSAGERHQLLVEWNDRGRDRPREATLVDLFAARAERSPDRPALRYRGQVLSYGELAVRAARLARRLEALGVGRDGEESRVGLCLERGPELVVAMLAVLAAGGAYVPFDPAYPRRRLEYLLEDSRAGVVLTRGRLGDLFVRRGGERAAAGRTPEIVDLDRDLPEAERDRDDRAEGLSSRARPAGLAYLIYTSGSTGRPKGVAIEHRRAAARVCWAREVFSAEELSGALAATSINFDLSVFEIFAPLCSGGTVILARDALELPELEERDRVRLVNTVPSAIAELVRRDRGLAAGERLPAGIQTVNLAGEPLRRALVDEIYRRPGVRRVLNLYGPSEDTTYSTFATVPGGTASEPTIGRPLTGTRAYVLDGAGLPAAAGAVGELYLGGRGLARGYLGHPARTAARFVPDGVSDRENPGARLYRTGDRARFLAGGELAFLGRFDHQVKVRGFRIELGEIEAALLGLEAVREAAVVVRAEPAAGGRETAHLVACLTLAEGRSADPSGLRAELARTLPAYLLPSQVSILDTLPLLPNGKVDRRALREIRPDLPAGSGAPPRGRLERAVAAAWRRALGLREVGVQDNFFELGGNSLLLVRVHDELRRTLPAPFDLTELFRHPTIASLAAYLEAKTRGSAPEAARPAAAVRRAAARRRRASDVVAILAMAGRFPGARNLEELWRNLCGGVESIRSFSDDQLLAAGVPPSDLRHPDYVKASGALADADLFDGAFFGLSPREAERLDPQQRIFLECAWEVLEVAGYGDSGGRGAVGVFAGASFSTYLFRLHGGGDPASSMTALQALISNDKDFLATRVAYKLDLKGPALSVQTACSTSLVAVHQACQSLLAGECDMALAGGVSVRVPLASGYFYQPDGIFSPDGHCRAFAADARGTVPGSGAGAVLLKPLAEALADGDPLVAVIRGSAVNNDGAVKVGYTAPSIAGQAAVVSEAWQVAGVDPATAGYVEAHGTGTPLGDPIEVTALNQVFGHPGPASARGRRALGSVKTNVGHLDAAAGVAGLIKAALVVRHGKIPPSLHCRKPHPDLDLASSFDVPGELRDWPEGAGGEALPRRAGVSSFGIGGTNCHVVLEEAPCPKAEEGVAALPAGPRLLVLSAASETALDQAAANLAVYLRKHPEAELADVAHTLQAGRKDFEHRRVLVCRDLADAVAALERPPAASDRGWARGDRSASLAFLFPGQGAPSAAPGLELYGSEPIFRREVDRCAEILSGAPRALLLAAGGGRGSRRSRRANALAQPALFVVEHALARLWMERVGAPEAMLGHSLGEYVAACLAGVFSLEDALRVVAERGRLMAALPAGAMLAVPLPEAELARRLGPDLSLAAVNAPDRTVASGPLEAIAALEERLAAAGVRCRRLDTSHAFHSAMMEPVLEPFERVLRGVARHPPRIPFVSNVTGDWIAPGEATRADYWIRHLRGTVRFSDGAARLLEDAGAIYVEIGPGRVLGALVQRQAGSERALTAVSSLPDSRRGAPASRPSASEHWLRAAGRAWAGGYAVDWRALGQEPTRRRRVVLPTYPFERRRYWLEPAPRRERSRLRGAPAAAEPAYHPRPGTTGDYAEPRGELERILAAIWSEVLGIERVGRHDDFFELGGDSLQATQVVSRARRVARSRVAELTVERIFRHSNLAALAARLGDASGGAAAPPVSGTALPALRPADREGASSLPLSFAQERLFFLDQLEPGRATYNVAVAVRVRGPLEVAALAAALAEVVRRHEALRTTFRDTEEGPLQGVARAGKIALPVIDLDGLAFGARRTVAAALVRSEARRPFDLAAGPLVRTLLIRRAGDRHTAVLTVHHIVADGWSMGVLVRELGAFYGAAGGSSTSRVRAPRLPALTVQPADVAHWERRALRGEVLERSLSFWRERLAGVPALELPTDRPRPARSKQLGVRLPLALPDALSRRLAEAGQRRGATLFMTLLATLAALLSRTAGQTDFAVGSPDANRDRLELEGLIGFFVNTLALRVELAGDPAFDELLARVREGILAAEAHRRLPFEKLVQEISPERHLARTPLFQVMLVLHNAPLGPIALPGLELEPVDVDTGTAKFDLTFELEEGDRGLRGAVEYDRELFDATTVARLWRRFELLAEGWTSRPETRLSQLPVLSAGERHQVLREWSVPAARAAPRGRTLVELFAEQVTRTPDAVALEWRDERLSYGELAARARRLARHLRGLGVRRGSRVGLLVERSLELWIGVLAILRAGAAYVPVDAGYPERRRRAMLRDAGVAAVVTVARRLAGARSAGSAAVVCLDRDRDAVVRRPRAASRPAAGPALDSDDLAYVLYTSGSTGRPKGVALPHRALAQLIVWQGRTARAAGGSRTLQFAPVSFDVSCQEAFATWSAGGTLVVASEDDRRDPARLSELVAERAIDRLFLPGAALHQLAEAVAEGLAVAPSRPREVIVAGERLRIAPAIVALFEAMPRSRLVNHYGPTETHVVTWHALAGPPHAWPALPPIGRPISGARVRLLDPCLRPLPAGVAGELYAGGAAPARGYLHRPRETAERFLPDPWSGVPGARLYRTGDRARHLAGGEIEFLGRADDQVKVRGYRVEPGEVEAALGEHPRVRQAAVLVDGPPPGRLAAYITLRESAGAVADAELRRHLAERLPDYMVPSAFAVLDELPLTASGKVARRSLPALAPAVPASGRPFRSPAEELVAGVWAEVLGVASVGPDDDFFELGGHSLLATRAVARLRRIFPVKIALRELFLAPTAAALAARLTAARERRIPAPPLVAGAGGETPPLSFAQERMWFLAQMEPGSALYNLPFAVRLRGDLDRDAFEAAFREVVRRHQPLRVRFVDDGGKPRLAAAPAAAPWLPSVDLAGVAPECRARTFEALAGGEARRPFDLATGPLYRALLVTFSPGEWVFFLNLHHIVADGWSIGVLTRELEAFYEAARRRCAPALPALAVRYGDFARWQRELLDGERLAGERLAGELDFWRRQLAGVPALELPTDRPRPRVRSGRGRSLPALFPPALTGALRALARRHGTTLFTVLLAGYQTVLARLCGQTRVAVGTPVAGRAHPELEGLIGCFVNTLVLASELGPLGGPGTLDFSTLLLRVREVTLAAYEHQEVPFEKLVDELEPERSGSGSPLFQVSLALLNAPLDTLALPDLEAEPVSVSTGTAKFDLTLALVESAEGLEGVWEADADLFDKTTVRRLGEHLARLLAAAAEAPARRLEELPLLGPAQRHQLLVEWNDGAELGKDVNDGAELGKDVNDGAELGKVVNDGAELGKVVRRPAATVTELFLARARRAPDALAICDGSRATTYGELATQARRLAGKLAAAGVGPEAIAGVVLERSPELVVAEVAILVAGGAYLPLDPSQPAARLAEMLGDAGVAALVTRRRIAERLTASDGWPKPGPAVLLADPERAAPESQPATERSGSEMRNDGAARAYVIYTSGSTGRPKGTEIHHGGLLNLVHWHLDAYGLEPDDRATLLASPGFDASVWEIWPHLAAGASLHIAPAEVLASSSALLHWLEEHRITRSFLPTPLAEAVLAETGPPPASLRTLLTGGDRLLRRPSDGRWTVVNHYGPTENSVVATAGQVALSGPEPPTIGRPIPDVETYVVDRRGRAVAAGVAGELWIGGGGLMRGYLRRPALTAERIVPNPFDRRPGGPRPGARLYRSGDRVRHRLDGELDFLGRLDDQVKLRGYRIELGEIAATLLEHPAVGEALVLALGKSSAGSRLAAFLRPAGGSAPEASELRAFLETRLPPYMVPATLRSLDDWPLTASGKIDRKALAALEESAGAARAGGSEAPATPEEEILAGLWSDLLDVEPPGRDADFFELGGHSLLATQLASRIRHVFGVELPLSDLFAEPTVRGLARHVETARQREVEILPAIEAAGRDDAGLPLSYAQERLWFLHQLQPESPFYSVPVALRLDGLLAGAALDASLGEIVRRHRVLRAVFENRDGVPVQRLAAPRPWRSPRVDLSRLAAGDREKEFARLAAAEALRPFDLARGPLLRASLLRLAEERHVLLLNQHHAVSDGWSIGILARELAALYDAFAAGRPSPLPELEIQYADFARWQRRFLGEALAAQLDAWRTRLAGAPALLELPTDRPRPASPSFRGAAASLRLSGELSAALAGLGRRRTATLFMTLLAGFQTLLSRYSGQRDLCLGTPIAGRHRLEIEELIGCFVNTLVMRGDLSGDPSFEELLERTREASLRAHAHQDLPFERLVEELAPERSLGHMPLFQVWFTLQNVPRDPPRLAGLELSPLELASETSKFDLNLSMVEEPEGLRCVLEYSTDLFEAPAMERLLAHFRTLLGEAVADPSRALSALSLLSAAERHELVVEVNATAVERRWQVTVPELFAASARRHRGEVAVEQGSRRLSYGELARRAGELARQLRARGVGRGSRVGLFLEPSPESVVGVLGVLASGAAYVPLDPGHPRRQLEHVVADAEIGLLLTQERLAATLADREPAVEVLCLDGDPWPPAGDRGEPPAPSIWTRDLAYVIYTSGSTGRPKGVEIEHGALLDYVEWAREVYLGGEPVGFALCSSLAFDLTVTSIFPPLVSGGRVAIYADAELEPAVLRAVEGGRAEVVKLTPSHLALLKGRDLEGSRIRRLIVGGEALSTELASEAAAGLGGQVEIFNEYGPTEATVGCMLHRFDAAADRRASVPIGLPAANARVYVLDASLEPVAENVAGELFLAGAGLARGYLGRGALTAASFVPDPWGDGGRLYRSGDLARWLVGRGAARGLEFVGRRDQQVKFHGYRVELEGIRGALNEHPAVRDSVVVTGRLAGEDGAEGQEVLVAYYAARQAVAAAELRSFLGERLIAETVPGLYVHLRRLPLTLNGKLNAAALPPVEAARGQLARRAAAPAGPAEELLAGIWSRVLGVEGVGVEENFFELGGHSLLATQVVSRVRALFGVELPLKQLFAAPTVAKLAAVIAELRTGRRGRSPAIEPVARDGPLPLSFAQRRLWFLHQLDPVSPAYNVPMAVRLTGRLDLGALASSLAALVARHEVLRTALVEIDGEPRQVISRALRPALPVVDLSGLAAPAREHQAEALSAEERRRPFDLARAPLLRAVLLRLVDPGEDASGAAAGVCRLLLTLHHVVTDGWSMGVLVREIAEHYRAGVEGGAADLPALPIQYGDFAVWQRQRLAGERLEQHLDYWRSRLGEVPELSLPVDREAPSGDPGAAGALCPVALGAGTSRALRELARRQGGTVFMSVMAALQAFLHPWSSGDSVVVGTEIARRDRLETENLIGFFVNALPIHVDVGGDPSFGELIERVREATLEAYEHQELPFDKLVEELAPERGLGRSPFFRVLLVFQNFDRPELELPGLRLAVGGVQESAKFDLLLVLSEEDGCLRGSWIYRTGLFEAATIERLARRFEALAARLAAAPDRPLAELRHAHEEAELRSQRPPRRRRRRRDRPLAAAAQPDEAGSAEQRVENLVLEEVR